MSAGDAVPEGVRLDRGEARLDAAARQLREVRSPRTVEIADRVLARTLATPRRSRLMRAASPHDRLRVSTIALTASLRAHLDARLDGAAVGRVLLDVSDDEELTAMTIELYVRYRTDVLAAGDQARRLADEVLADVLGVDRTRDVVVATTHVHVSDVTVGDPRLVDPRDE